MQEQINNIISEIDHFLINNHDDLESFRLKYLSKKGVINQLFSQFKALPKEEKKIYGQKINELKQKAESIFYEKNTALKKSSDVLDTEDHTLPPYPVHFGSYHPISIIKNRIIKIFKRIGFTISSGPEIEDDWHVFSALNFPPEHPARDMQDTFFIQRDPDILLRTHTSSIQVRVMDHEKPPIRTLSPGRVFRNEAISARAHCIFHQVEGLYIDTDVSFADLKQVLMYFAKEMFGHSTKTRFRPSFFPFTEPSAEMDVQCNICSGTGCNVCKYSGWLEIMGCGMVDPAVLRYSDIDPSIYTGYAFGMGVERIAQLIYKVNDLRKYFENDIRFLNQFKHAVL